MNTHPYNGHLSGTTWVGRYQNKHSPTHTHPVHQTSFINFLHLLRSIASSLLIYVLDGLFSTIFFSQHIQVLFGLPLCLLVWNPLLYTPYISSRSHYLLFATHAHTITAFSAVVPVLCRLFSADMCDCVVSQWQLLAVCEWVGLYFYCILSVSYSNVSYSTVLPNYRLWLSIYQSCHGVV